jgi:CTP synthase
MQCGIQPTIIACRAATAATDKIRQKISVYSNVPFERVISLPDTASIYMIPAMLRDVGLDFEVARLLKIEDRINLRHERKAWAQWCDFTDKIGSAGHEVTIGITGKYTSVRDSYASIINALEHAGIALSCSVKIKWIETTDLTDENVAAHLEDVREQSAVSGALLRLSNGGYRVCAQRLWPDARQQHRDRAGWSRTGD